MQATLLARRAIAKAGRDRDALAVLEKATRMQATLATRLRLAPQARTDPKTLARQEVPPRNPLYRNLLRRAEQSGARPAG